MNERCVSTRLSLNHVVWARYFHIIFSGYISCISTQPCLSRASLLGDKGPLSCSSNSIIYFNLSSFCLFTLPKHLPFQLTRIFLSLLSFLDILVVISMVYRRQYPILTDESMCLVWFLPHFFKIEYFLSWSSRLRREKTHMHIIRSGSSNRSSRSQWNARFLLRRYQNLI